MEFFSITNYWWGLITKCLLHTYMHKYISLLIKQLLEFLFFNDDCKRHLMSISYTKVPDVLSFWCFSCCSIKLLNTCIFQFSISGDAAAFEPLYSCFALQVCNCTVDKFLSKNVPFVNFVGIAHTHKPFFVIYIQILTFQLTLYCLHSYISNIEW